MLAHGVCFIRVYLSKAACNKKPLSLNTYNADYHGNAIYVVYICVVQNYSQLAKVMTKI